MGGGGNVRFGLVWSAPVQVCFRSNQALDTKKTIRGSVGGKAYRYNEGPRSRLGLFSDGFGRARELIP